MVKYKHLILRLDDNLDKLHGSCMLSKIDLKISYHQIKMKKGDKKEKITLKLNVDCLNG
jgi:hypothetical protein